MIKTGRLVFNTDYDCNLYHFVSMLLVFACPLWCPAAPTGDGSLPRQLLSEVPLAGGEHLTVVAQKTSLAATAARFAMYCSGVAYVDTWGSAHMSRPGNEPFPEPLRNGTMAVLHISATDNAFAAILEDGTVVAWGDRSCGGDCSKVAWELVNVQQIEGAEAAFAAIQQDGHVVTWGAPHGGGNSRGVQNALVGVRAIRSTTLAFAAIRHDGHVVTWGDPDYGGDSQRVRYRLENVQNIQGSERAFGAILEDGAVVTWGDPDWGGDTGEVQAQLKDVKEIGATRAAFAAILADGRVVTWGDAACGADSSSVQDQLRDVQCIKGTKLAFAAIRADGTASLFCLWKCFAMFWACLYCNFWDQIWWVSICCHFFG